MSKSLVDQLLAEQDDTAEMQAAETMILDEELAMRKMGAAFGILDSEGAGAILQEQNIIVHLNRQSKTNNLAHRQAILFAKAKKDPLYDRYAKFNGLRLQLRALIYRKYGSKAVSRARQLMSGTTVAPMTK